MPNPKHHNPGQNRAANAPYNFVPLPEKVVTVKAEEIPSHDRFEFHTGYIDCTLTTESPVYTRCAQNLEFFKKFADNPKDIRLNPKDRREYAQFFNLNDTERPVILGSSLRGMVRSLVEIGGYGKVQWVTRNQLAYRSVGGTDSLKDFYSQRVLKYEGKKSAKLKDGKTQNVHHFTPLVQAGYLVQRNGNWFICPAQTIGGTTFARIHHKDFQKIRANLPQWHNCKNARKIWVRLGRYEYQPIKGGFIQLKYTPVLEAKELAQSGFLEAVLVESGPMQKKEREAVIYPPDEKADLIPVDIKLIDAYREQISQEQKNLLGEHGVLNNQQPIFYLMENHKLIFFGHTMLLRLAYENTPYDFVPKHLREEIDIDLAEAIFGYTPEDSRKEGRAGRVYFTDAHYEKDEAGIWLQDNDEIITPKILSAPKPTTFQHYLVQDKSKGHDPDNKKTLAHYGTPSPNETVIRGHKLYWHKGPVTRQDIAEREEPDWSKDTQHTQIRPVKPGVTFRFKIYFENLRDYELGALLWALDLPADCRHKIGMGKPLGMGAVKIAPRLILSDRSKRYSQLFNDNNWATSERDEANIAQFKQAFEEFVLKEMDDSERKSQFREVERIKMLLAMLQWPGPAPERTKYMTLEGEDGRKFRERYVLPDPLHLEGQSQMRHPSQPPQPRSLKPGQKPPVSPPSRQATKPTVTGQYSISYTFTAKVEVTWNEKTMKSETKMPNGAPAILDMSRKAAAKLHGQTVQLVVSDFKDGIYYLKQA